MITDTAERLRLAALEAWRTTGIDEPGVSHVVTGTVAVDDCCSGMLVVSIDQLVWWSPFPFEALQRAGTSGVVVPFASAQPCIGTLGAAVTIWLVLCVPVLDDEGGPPPEQIESDAMMRLTDLAETVSRTLVCADEDCWVVGGVSFLGPDGGCLIAQIAGRIDRC